MERRREGGTVGVGGVGGRVYMCVAGVYMCVLVMVLWWRCGVEVVMCCW